MGLCLLPSLSEETLQGFKYFRLLGPLFDHLHLAATERDRAGNRQLFYDQYASLLLLYFFNAMVTSLRGLQQTTTLAEHAALGQLIAVAGSLLPALPRMAWALWQDEQHRAAKMHVAFAGLRQGPVDVTV